MKKPSKSKHLQAQKHDEDDDRRMKMKEKGGEVKSEKKNKRKGKSDAILDAEEHEGRKTTNTIISGQKKVKRDNKKDKKKRKRDAVVEEGDQGEYDREIIIDDEKNGESTNNISSESKVKVKKSEKGSKRKKHKKKHVDVEEGQSSTVLCPMCYEKKARGEIFEVEGCNHMLCKECVTNYVRVKIQENVVTAKCPNEDYEFRIEPQNCKDIVPDQVIERWETVLCESAITASQKYYCPYKECSALLLNETEHEEIITASECPFCHRLFCAQCKVPWHGDLTCEAYQRRLGEDDNSPEDVMLFELAKAQNWRRCKTCGFMVDRIEGCEEMKCRCGHVFCYQCGGRWRYGHICRNNRTSNDEKLRRTLGMRRRLPQTQHVEQEASTVHQHIGHAQTSYQHIGHANCVDASPGYKPVLISIRRPGRLRKSTTVTPQTQHVEQEASTVHQQIGHSQTSYQPIGHARRDAPPGQNMGLIGTRRTGRLRNSNPAMPQN